MRTSRFVAAAFLVACSSRPSTTVDEPHASLTRVSDSQGRAAAGDELHEPPMSFFVTSRGMGTGADLGGLEGADRHCQTLADAVFAGHLTWRAYLSTAETPDARGVDARDRIGQGPWFNANRELVARDLVSLHSEANGLTRRATLTEHGEIPAKTHDILTGSNAQGRVALTGGEPATCGNWTTSGEGVARIGHSDRMDSESFANPRFKRWYGSWNSEHDTLGCGVEHLAASGGSGALYCFAADDFSALVEHGGVPSDGRVATFERGVTIDLGLGRARGGTEVVDASEGQPWIGREDMVWISDHGFDHVRLGVAGHAWVGPDGNLDDHVVSHFDHVLAWARERRLGVVLAMRSTPGFRDGAAPTAASSPFTDEATRGDAAYLWWLVARRYAAMGEALRFEVLERPDAPDADRMQAFNRAALAAIRRISPERVVYLAAHDHSMENVAEVDLSDLRTGLSVRFSEPRGPSRTGVSVAEAIDAFGVVLHAMPRRPVLVAAFGALDRAVDSPGTHLRTVREALERNGLGWAVHAGHSIGAIGGPEGEPTRMSESLGLPARG